MWLEIIYLFKIHFCILGLHTSLVSQPLPKSKKPQSKGGKKERTSSGTTRKAKRTKYPEILSDESSSDEDEKKEKDESSEEKESEDEVMSSSVCFPALCHCYELVTLGTQSWRASNVKLKEGNTSAI